MKTSIFIKTNTEIQFGRLKIDFGGNDEYGNTEYYTAACKCAVYIALPDCA